MHDGELAASLLFSLISQVGMLGLVWAKVPQHDRRVRCLVWLVLVIAICWVVLLFGPAAVALKSLVVGYGNASMPIAFGIFLVLPPAIVLTAFLSIYRVRSRRDLP